MIALLAGASLGMTGFFLGSYKLAAAGLVPGVVGVAFSLVGLWRAIGRAPEIPSLIKRKLRSNLLLFGPVPALQLLFFTYRPNSGFSGLGGSRNATHT